MQSRNIGNLRGTDISNYQKEVDYAGLKAAGIQAVYIRLCEGEHTTDPVAPAHSAGVDGAGLHKGFYHYFHPSEDAKAQADFFAGQLKKYPFDCIPAVDVEVNEGLDPGKISAGVKDFIEEIKAQIGVECMVYSSINFANTYFTSALTPYRLWVAHYGVDNPGESPVWGQWTGFQYSNKDAFSGGDSDEFTADILLNGAAQAASAAAPAGWTKDVYIAPALPYPVNAAAGRDFPVLNADGSAAPGHSVSGKDELIIAGVDYGRQLAEVYYPNYSAGHWIHGYIANDQAHIHDKWHYQWKNGSTPEITFDAAGNRVGSIDPGEKATPLYRKNGKLGLLYDTAKGMESKFGFVAYNGGFAGF